MKPDWSKTLNACVYKLCEEYDFALMFTQTGAHPSSWPNCLAKDLALEFYEVKEQKSLQSAMVKISGAADKLPRNELNYRTAICLEEINNAIKTGIGLQLAAKLKEDPASVFEIITEHKEDSSQDCSVDLGQKSGEYFKRMVDTLESTKNTNRTVSGYPLLSSLIGGFNDNRITLFVAGSGVGKTTFMLNFVLSAIKDHACLFINMEMSIEDMLKRISCIISESSQSLLENFNHRSAKIMANAHSYLLSNKNLYMTDGRNLTLQQIASSIYRRASQGAKFVIVDYDQKIKTTGNDQEWKEILTAMEYLEDIAKRTGTHIIVLAQGDDNNNPKASKRSVQPCSAVLAFYEENSKYYIESKKNRFGRKFRLEMSCDFSIYKVTEKQEVPINNDPLKRLL